MKWLPYLCLLLVLAFVDQRFLDNLNLQVARLELFFRSLPLRLKLEWDIYFMKNNMKKYIKMAEEIRREIDGTD